MQCNSLRLNSRSSRPAPSALLCERELTEVTFQFKTAMGQVSACG
jgi:hypothetical protein